MLDQANPFYSHLLSHFEARKELDPLASWRNKGWQRLADLGGLPDKSLSSFQYVPLREFYGHTFEMVKDSKCCLADVQRLVYPECAHSYFVFVDGVLRLDLSDLSALPSSVILLPLHEAERKFAHLLNHRLNTAIEKEKDPFAALNLALHTQGAFLSVPPQVEIKTPIQCVYISTENKLSAPRLHLFVGAQAQVKWICSSSNSTAHFSNTHTDLVLEEGARFQAVHVVRPNESSWHFESFRATVKKDAELSCLSVTTGSKTVRQDFRIALAGHGASASLQGIAMLKDKNHSHVHVHMDHQAPHTQSSQLFKGVLCDVSHSSFEGKIYVHEQAQKTQAYQLNKHLILGKHAQVFAKPNLEIFADDVKASHGATVAQIDPAQLFYLKTRGIDQALAKNLLVSAFAQEILTQISHLSIAQEMQILLNDYLKFKDVGNSEQNSGI
ncbi:MAG: Fe-S cluster assembly protein SufD [Rhabdochlamydiaceae bacterium]|nr:Fe-S cluster assembly protein SufD [Rhabdochlamydiaceae bacterium]